MPSIKILRNDVFHALAGLNPRKAYGRSKKTVTLSTMSIDFYLSFMLEVGLHSACS
ncbi:hypothetical protein E2C01_055528 [Portunus trituberculatus]|uniref:Uncharacterized protein n=1 Tax=Portunus trituberculatus TaxID=210409 RepID=A0A5B7GV12_PORTR|nr:hypothetical protein [Portunus trituberculatus]